MSRIVKCMCEECLYNSNNACTADAVEIRSSNNLRVNSADDTMCSTFRSRKGGKEEGNIYTSL